MIPDLTDATGPEDPVSQHLGLLENLTSGGIARVPPFVAASIGDAMQSRSLRSFYISLHESRRADAPGRAPTLEHSAAVWGGLIVHWALWAILDRGQANIRLPETLQKVELDPNRAETHWAIDLIAAVWPDVHSRCTKISEDDPLTTTIEQIAISWPLCAIGMSLPREFIESKILKSTTWATITNHPTLRRIAADRVERHQEPVFREALNSP